MPIFLNIPETRRTYAVFAFLMVVLAALAFGRLYTHQFWEGWDDWDMITDAERIANNPTYMFSSDRTLPARPPLDLVFMTEYMLWGSHPERFRMTQVAFHLLASLMLCRVFRRLGANLETSFLASCLFLLNVAHFRAVHWAICIDRIAALVFSIGALLAHLRYLRSRKTYWATMATGLIIIAIFNHPSAAPVGLFCLYITWRQSASLPQALSHSWHILVSVSIAGLIAYWISPHVNQVQGALTVPDFARIFQNALWYLGRLLSSAHWVTPATTGNNLELWEMGLGLLAISGILFLYHRRIFPAADWAIWSLITIVPFLNNPIDRLAFGPSRQLYFASIGTSFIIAWGLQRICAFLLTWLSAKTVRLIYISIIGLLVSISIVSLRQAEALSVYFAGRGYAFRVNDDRENTHMAIQLFERAIHQSPTLVPLDAYRRLLGMGLTQGNPHRHVIERGIEKHPNDPVLKLLLSIAEFAESYPQDHGVHMQRILQQIDASSEREVLSGFAAALLQNLATYYHVHRQYAEAVQIYEYAIDLDPSYTIAYFNMGNVLNKLGESEKAMGVYGKLGALLYRRGETAKALDLYRTLAEQHPDNSAILYNLGMLHLELKQFDQASAMLQQADMLNPNDVEIQEALAKIRAKQHDNQETRANH